jgi:hypothetical protein
MRPISRIALALVALLALATAAEAARVRVGHRGPRHTVVRTTVVVHPAFPLHRALPRVYVRPPVVAVRVAPRVFLPPVVFGATVVALPAADALVWTGTESFDADDEWTEATMNIDRVGERLLLEISRGPATVSFLEVVFENGDAQVVDFADRSHAPGVYTLATFAERRKVDHVRLVARADRGRSELTLRLAR